jgi:hypothetical protein
MLVAPCAWALEFEGIAYDIVAPGSPSSARDAAQRILQHLARGEIEAAAQLSNAPERRAQVLRDYLASVGDAEFRRVYAQYGASPLAVEIALGERHLLIWDLPGSAAGQFFVRQEGAFLLDDVPSAERRRLQRLLRAYREGKFRPSGGTG